MQQIAVNFTIQDLTIPLEILYLSSENNTINSSFKFNITLYSNQCLLHLDLVGRLASLKINNLLFHGIILAYKSFNPDVSNKYKYSISFYSIIEILKLVRMSECINNISLKELIYNILKTYLPIDFTYNFLAQNKYYPTILQYKEDCYTFLYNLLEQNKLCLSLQYKANTNIIYITYNDQQSSNLHKAECIKAKAMGSYEPVIFAWQKVTKLIANHVHEFILAKSTLEVQLGDRIIITKPDDLAGTYCITSINYFVDKSNEFIANIAHEKLAYFNTITLSKINQKRDIIKAKADNKQHHMRTNIIPATVTEKLVNQHGNYNIIFNNMHNKNSASNIAMMHQAAHNKAGIKFPLQINTTILIILVIDKSNLIKPVILGTLFSDINACIKIFEDNTKLFLSRGNNQLKFNDDTENYIILNNQKNKICLKHAMQDTIICESSGALIINNNASRKKAEHIIKNIHDTYDLAIIKNKIITSLIIKIMSYCYKINISQDLILQTKNLNFILQHDLLIKSQDLINIKGHFCTIKANNCSIEADKNIALSAKNLALINQNSSLVLQDDSLMLKAEKIYIKAPVIAIHGQVHNN